MKMALPIKAVIGDVKAEFKPSKFIATFVVVIVVLWAIVFLSKKFGWFKAVNPLAA